MYKRSAILICLLLVALSGFIFVKTVDRATELPSSDAFGSGVESGGKYYYVDGGREGFRLFKLSSDGEVLGLYTAPDITATDIAADVDQLYVLQEDEIRTDVTGRYRSYRLRCFTDSLLPTGTSSAFELHAGEHASDIYIQNGIVYITSISADGKVAEVYPLELQPLMAAGEEEAKARAEAEEKDEVYEAPPATMSDSIMLKEAGKGRFYVDALYREGELYTRNDSDPPIGAFAHDPGLKRAIRSINFSFKESVKMAGSLAIYWAAGTALMLVFLILTFMAFSNRRRLVYTGLLVEIVFLAMLFAFFVAYSNRSRELKADAREDYADNGMNFLAAEMGDIDRWAAGSGGEKWYDSTAYRGAQGTLSDFIKQDGNSKVFYDLLVIRCSDSSIICSASGRSGEIASEFYGESELWEDLQNKDVSGKYVLGIVGRGFEAKALLQNGTRSNYGLVAIINESNASDDNSDSLMMLRNLFLIFLVGSVVLFLIIWLQASDLRRFESALNDVAIKGSMEKDGKKRRTVAGHDLDSMWNSLGEIDRRIEKIDYSRYKIYEAYYRFAPRNIEHILRKNSIFEVECGNTANVTGTLAFVAGNRTASADIRVNQLNGLLTFLSENEDKEGIIVEESNGLTVTELLFLERATNTQEFAVDFIRSESDYGINQNELSVLLYYGGFMYGVAGTNIQSMPFILSDESRQLNAFAEWFHQKRIYAVVTEEVTDREGGDYDLRYVGFTVLENGRELRFYEILDACSKRERQARLEDRERFGEALEHLYKKDYYIARNAFSDILKRNPGDEIARWYLFECERLLDKTGDPSERAGALRADLR